MFTTTLAYGLKTPLYFHLNSTCFNSIEQLKFILSVCFRWNYVVTGTLEVDVKPRLHMWSWEHIRQHRQKVKHYRELYKMRLTSKNPSEELLLMLEVCK